MSLVNVLGQGDPPISDTPMWLVNVLGLGNRGVSILLVPRLTRWANSNCALVRTLDFQGSWRFPMFIHTTGNWAFILIQKWSKLSHCLKCIYYLCWDPSSVPHLLSQLVSTRSGLWTGHLSMCLSGGTNNRGGSMHQPVLDQNNK